MQYQSLKTSFTKEENGVYYVQILKNKHQVSFSLCVESTGGCAGKKKKVCDWVIESFDLTQSC